MKLEKLSARQLFLADSAGALLTAAMTGLVLPHFEHFFGMPAQPLIMLSLVACGFCLYSFACYRFLRRHHAPYLRAIGIANLMYCCFTVGAVIYHRASVTAWGWAYFLIETVIVLLLANIELKKVAALTRRKPA